MPRTSLGLALVWCCQYGALASRHRVRAAARASGLEVDVSEGNLSTSSTSSGGSLQRFRLGSNGSLADVMRSMTLERAINITEQKAGLPEGLRTLLQKLRDQVHIGAERRGSLRAPGYDLKGATEALNRLYEEAQRRLDLEQVQCSEYENKQRLTLGEARRQQDDYAAQAAAAKADILTAQASIDKGTKGRADLKDTMRRSSQKCEMDQKVAQQQLARVKDNIAMMEKVIPRMDCSQGQDAAALVQCQDGQRSSSLLGFERRLLRRALVGLRPSLRDALWRSLLREVQHSVQPPDSNATAVGLGSSIPPPTLVVNVSDQPTSRSKQRAKCTSTERPTCMILTDKMLMIQTAMMDKVDEIREELATMMRRCKAAEANFALQMSSLESRVRDAQGALAEGMTVQTQNSEESRLKELQVKALVKEFDETMGKCKESFATIEHEMCGVKKIRTELYAMSDKEQFIQDCEISEWTPDECSVSCGGGEQRLRRGVVTIPSSGGAGCPPLQMTRRCSQQACPVDCSVGQWSPWSACTATCGGGVRQRARNVKQPPLHGGKTCGQTSQVEGCNLQACDKDCKLASWSEWSACSRMCGGGVRERRRSRKSPPQGAGTCLDPDAPERLEYLGCNEAACTPAPGQATLRCNSTLDVVILLQGSAGIRKEGWEAMKLAGERLARAFAGGASRVGLVLFSGPRNTTTFLACSRGAQPGAPMPDVEKDCKVRWVSHLTSDVESVAQKVKGLAYPRGTTLTSTALATTAAEMSMARVDAGSTVIVISNGRVMSPRLTRQASALVRERARLLWVPVTTFSKLSGLREWVSKPVRENLVRVKGFKMLAQPEAVSEIVSRVCPLVA